MKNRKVLLVGWDAADWKIIGPLLAKGQMPALKKLIDIGVYGNISTMNPPYSPMLWSSIATGKTPDKHGVLGFVELHPEQQTIRPVTVNSRKSLALWNIFHHKGLKSNIVGWWPSYPAEKINGVVISDKFQSNLSKDKSYPKNTIHPSHLEDDYKELRLLPEELTEAHIIPFIPKAAEINIKDKKHKALFSAFSKILAKNTTVHAAATRVMRTTEWDFMAVYYDMIDHFCHNFMRFHPPKLKQVPQESFDYYKDVVEGAYRYQDMMLDRMISLADENTTIIVMSDHGYESTSKRILKMPKYPAAPALEHRRFGIFVAAGPDIEKNKKIYGLSLLDVAPTILHYYGLPIGKDMDGKPLLDMFTDNRKPEYIDSWELIDGDFGLNDFRSGEDTLSDQEALDQLIELGYIDRPDEKIEKAIYKTKCDIKHNLARVHMGKKNFDKSKEILSELIQAENINRIPFYMDLLTISLQEEDYTLAEKYLLKLRELDKGFMINTTLVEAKILISKRNYNSALKLLEEVESKNAANSGILLELGDAYFKLNRFHDAIKAYEKGLQVETDNAKLHYGMAASLYQIDEYEEAVDHALTSIELVRFFPSAHYILGCSLDKLGDFENAKKAFEMAKKLKPKMYKAEKAIENVAKKLEKQSGIIKNPDIIEDIIVVSGLPRSGTSLMMQMLAAGGLNLLIDDNRKADISNPKGYFEYEPVKSIFKDNSWLDKAKDKGVKIVSPLLKHLDPKYRYKIIFMERDLNEILISQQKMLNKDTSTFPSRLHAAYTRELKNFELWKKNQPGVSVINIDYNNLIFNNEDTVGELISFLKPKVFDRDKMLSTIDRDLYRNRIN